MANSPHVRQHQLLIVKLSISGEAARAELANANAIQIVRTIKTIGAITVVVPRNFIRDLIHWRSKRFPRWSSAEKEGSKAGDGIWFRRSQKKRVQFCFVRNSPRELIKRGPRPE